MRAWFGLLLLAAGFLAIVAMSEPPKRFSEPVQPNCTTDRLDYDTKLPRFHVGLHPKQDWWNGGCPDWRRRHTFGMA